jgi:hypothetical protein
MLPFLDFIHPSSPFLLTEYPSLIIDKSICDEVEHTNAGFNGVEVATGMVV